MRRAAAALVGLLAVGLLVACGDSEERDASQQPQGASLRITIGTQEFPEARILGELWREALAVNGYAVDLQKGIGPAEDLDEALKDGDIDGYVAYTGTVLSIVAGEEVSGLDPEETYGQAKEFYAGQDMMMSEMTPFQNKDAIATTPEYAGPTGSPRSPTWPTYPPSRSAPDRSSRTSTSASMASRRSTASPTPSSPRSSWARSTPLSTTGRSTRSTPSPPTRSWRVATTRSSRIRTCCSARRTW